MRECAVYISCLELPRPVQSKFACPLYEAHGAEQWHQDERVCVSSHLVRERYDKRALVGLVRGDVRRVTGVAK